MDVFFLGERATGGHTIDPSGLIRSAKPNAPKVSAMFSRFVTLHYLNLAFGYEMWNASMSNAQDVFTVEEHKFRKSVLTFTDEHGLLFSDTETNPTYLSDYAKLAAQIALCEKSGRSQLGFTIDNHFQAKILETYDDKNNPQVSIEAYSMSQAIWLDYIINGTSGFQRCEYYRLYGSRKVSGRKKCSEWMKITFKGQIWCSDACRVAAYRKGKEGS